jgi:hypothetical protein
MDDTGTGTGIMYRVSLLCIEMDDEVQDFLQNLPSFRYNGVILCQLKVKSDIITRKWVSFKVSEDV